MKLKGGVLIIGSLYWQGHRDGIDNKRKKWRNERLNMSTVFDVSVPIRYGRLSKDGTYTIILDKHLSEEQFGNAKVVPLKNSLIQDIAQLVKEAKELSKAEGEGQNLVKGIQNGKEAWCVCAILINPDLPYSLKGTIQKEWLAELMKTPDPKNVLNNVFENKDKYSITEFGELDITYPKGATDFDILIATATKERLCEPMISLNIEEISKNIFNRSYFLPNRANLITTYQDGEIMKSCEEYINRFIKTLSESLLYGQFFRMKSDSQWTKEIPIESGVYGINENGKWIYFGETTNLKRRFGDLYKSRNHAFRRSIGEKLFGSKLPKYSERQEEDINKYYDENLHIKFLPVKIGRAEIEEYLTDKFSETVLNIRKKRS